MNVYCEQEDNFTLVTIEGPLVVPESDNFKEFIMRMLEKGRTNLLFDLSNVSYIDSSGVSILLSLLQAAKKVNGDLRLACLNERIRETIRNIGLNHVFRKFETVEDGIKSFEDATVI